MPKHAFPGSRSNYIRNFLSIGSAVSTRGDFVLRAHDALNAFVEFPLSRFRIVVVAVAGLECQKQSCRYQ